MRYRKFEGSDWLRRALIIRGDLYLMDSIHVEGAGGAIAFSSEGRKAVVYKLRHSGGTYHALKVFHRSFALIENIMCAMQLARYSRVAGLSVCDRRVLLENEAISLNEPGLAFAVLMPWMPGKAWAEIVGDREPLPQDHCIALARELADVLAGLEARGLTHADISSSNVFVVTGRTPSVELIDVEDMYHTGFAQPVQMPAGTPGYNYPRGTKTGNWNAYGDRFAAAVILAEILTWHQPGIRAACDEFNYFHRDEMCRTPLEKYDTMIRALQLHSATVANLFQRAWQSSSLRECPTLAEWQGSIARVKATATTVSGPAPSLTWARSSLLDLYSRKADTLDTVYLSSFVCFECGYVVAPGKPLDHKPTCSQHSEPTIDLGKGLSDLYRISGIQSSPPAAPARDSWKPTIKGTSTCSECGNLLLGNLGFFHTPTCSHHGASTFAKAPTPPSTTGCDECGNEISRSDGTDHGLFCSKHPGYSRSQPSQFRNVRFAPLIDPEPTPTPPAFDLADSIFGPAARCPECKKLVKTGSLTLRHAPNCSKRGIGV